MPLIEIKQLVDSINHIEAVKILLDRINTEGNLPMRKHKTLLEGMSRTCTFLVDNIRIIEQDISES